MWVYLLIKTSEGIINSRNANYLAYLPELGYIEDILIIRPKFDRKILVRLDEDVEKSNVDNILKGLKILFYAGLLELDEDLMNSFKILLKKCKDPNERKALVFIEVLEKNDENTLLREYNSLTSKNARTIDELDLSIFYMELLKIGCPVFFKYEYVRYYNDNIYNGNFFLIKYKDKNGKIKLIWPFEQVPLSKVQKINDPLRNIWLIPSALAI